MFEPVLEEIGGNIRSDRHVVIERHPTLGILPESSDPQGAARFLRVSFQISQIRIL